MKDTNWYVETVSQVFHRALSMRLLEEGKSEIPETKEVDTGERKKLFSLTEDEVKNVILNPDFKDGFNLYMKYGKMRLPIRINPKDAVRFYSGIGQSGKSKSQDVTLKMIKVKNDNFFALGKKKEAKMRFGLSKKTGFVPVYDLEEKYDEPVKGANYLKGRDKDVWKLFSETWVLKLETKKNKVCICALKE